MNFFKYIIIFFFHFQIVFGCLNGETKILKNGVELYYADREVNSIPVGFKFFNVDIEKVKKDLQDHYNQTKDIDYLSNVGFIFILQKEYEKAMSLYFDIEKKNQIGIQRL